MEHQVSNQNKSINGNKFEQLFTELTGLVKEKKKDKPRFLNSHGLKQIIDYDFKTIIDGVEVYIDVTTTFRSDRLKQKSYNGLLLKLKNNPNCKYFLVVKSFTEKKRKKITVLNEGIDKVIYINEFMEIFNRQ